jgi:2-keto-4-pentenoate hydratase
VDEDEAYAWQDAVAVAEGWFGEGPARHWKSGGASRQGPQTHAALPPAGIWNHPVDATHWPFRLRGIEAEIALRLGQPVDAALAASLDVAAARRLVDAMCVSIEVVDSRWAEGRDAPALAKLADLQSHGALVLGEWIPFEARDWSAQRCTVQIGAKVPLQFTGTHSMADPAWVLPAWLRHATRQGAVLQARTLVSTGTWCGLLMARPGQRVRVAFEGIGEAHLQL